MVADQVDERENVEMAYFVESAHGQRLAQGWVQPLERPK